MKCRQLSLGCIQQLHPQELKFGHLCLETFAERSRWMACVTRRPKSGKRGTSQIQPAVTTKQEGSTSRTERVQAMAIIAVMCCSLLAVLQTQNAPATWSDPSCICLALQSFVKEHSIASYGALVLKKHLSLADGT